MKSTHQRAMLRERLLEILLKLRMPEQNIRLKKELTANYR